MKSEILHHFHEKNHFFLQPSHIHDAATLRKYYSASLIFTGRPFSSFNCKLYVTANCMSHTAGKPPCRQKKTQSPPYSHGATTSGLSARNSIHIAVKPTSKLKPLKLKLNCANIRIIFHLRRILNKNIEENLWESCIFLNFAIRLRCGAQVKKIRKITQ